MGYDDFILDIPNLTIMGKEYNKNNFKPYELYRLLLIAG
jgi:hypothetical protein